MENPQELNLFGLIKKHKSNIQLEASEILTKQKKLYLLEREQLLSGRKPLSYKNGYTMVPNQLIEATDLTAGEKLCFIHLLRYSWGTRLAWPSESRMAQEQLISVRTIQRHLTRLVRRGYLWVELVVKKGTRYYNRYHLNIDNPNRRK